MICAVGNEKGWVGKSTIVVNLAVEYCRRGLDVLIVEADPTVRTVSNWKEDRETDCPDAPFVPVVRQTGKIHAELVDLDKRYDVVLVDLPGKDSQEMRSALLVADLFLVPCQPSQADLDATVALTDTIEDSLMYNEDLKAAVVLNRVSTHAWSRDESDAREMLAESFDTVLKTVLHERKAFSRSLHGLTVTEGSDYAAAGELQSLADNIEECV